MIQVTNSHNLVFGNITYEIKDNEYQSENKIHRYTVIKWKNKNNSTKCRLESINYSIYARSAIVALKIFLSKTGENE